MSSTDTLLKGAIDIHTHSGPSPMPRRIDHVEAARQAAEAGFRAILVKCHYHSTVTDVLAMASQLEGIPTQVFGGIALNTVTGGLNLHAVDLAVRLGGRMVWFPTISSTAHLEHAAHNETTRAHFTPLGMLPQEPVLVIDESGAVLPQVRQILEYTRDAGVAISTGHLDAISATAIVEAAHEIGQQRILISHPNYVVGIDHERGKYLASLGAVFDQPIAMYDRLGDKSLFPFEDLLGWIEAVGPEHTVLGSDLGQQGNPLPVEVYRHIVPRLLDAGVSEEAIRQMLAVNPARLLGLDA
jgi:dihydroorotase-like cyclic amidohydrolase